jgi:hypothetical protein
MLNAHEIFLEDAGDINLECHQNHRPLLISKMVFLLKRHSVELNRGVFIDGIQQPFDFSLHISFVVTLTQVMRSELVL